MFEINQLVVNNYVLAVIRPIIAADRDACCQLEFWDLFSS
jgi:hypothetical protein